MAPQEKEYGEWESPLKSDDVVQASNSIVRMYFDRFDSSKYFKYIPSSPLLSFW